MTNTTIQSGLRRITAAVLLSALALTGAVACVDEGEETGTGVEEEIDE